MIRGLGLAFALLLLVGCGFRPMNAPESGPAAQAGAAEDVAADEVRIARIPNRTGQLVHNALTARLNPNGPPREPAYELSVRVQETVRQMGFRLDETATRANLELEAQYVLIDLETGARLIQGRMNSISSANILDQPYATVVVERNARERSAEDLAEKVARDVASWLRTRS